MLRTLDLRGLGTSVAEVLPRPSSPGVAVADTVRSIIEQVRHEGDTALRRLTLELDHHELDSIRVGQEAIDVATSRLDPTLHQALSVAFDRIVAYHGHEPTPIGPFHDGGVTVTHLDVPVDRAGCYAPGGRARYPSSVLMCAAPARVAGVRSIALCVPAGSDGLIDDATLAAASIAGIEEIYPLGGAQAIAAMAFGTESIRSVDVIVGPGNAYVAEAKRQVAGSVGIASAFAGPSEIVVIADGTTPPDLAAIDLMVQAEHGPDGMAWLVTWDPKLAESVQASLTRLIAVAPRRADLERTMATSGVVCLVDGPAAAAAVSNAVAPEHLELLMTDFHEVLDLVTAAGAVFCGLDAPASLGDYAAGPNHILPTNRSARFASSLRADDFRRHIHVVETTREGFENLAPTVIAIAEAEGLDAHAESIRMRR